MTQVLWTQRQDIGPDGRTGHAMAYDRGRQRTVLFGGRIAGGAVVGDTWEWDGADWTQVADTGPDPRSAHAMAYGAALVLFGGEDATSALRGDTWLRDGSGDWTQVADTGPSPRRGHAVAYDAARDLLVLFAGEAAGATLMNDTWTWDGTAWTQVQDVGPSARSLHAMAYDPARERVVLFGGATAAGAVRDTWEWDGTAWTSVQDIGPPAALGGAMASIGGSVLLVGGASSATAGPPPPVVFRDSWEWSGTFWTDRADIGPRARWAACVAFDSDRGRAVLFGGDAVPPADPNVATAVLGDTWEAPFAAEPGGQGGPGGPGQPGAVQLIEFTITPDTITPQADITFGARVSSPAPAPTEVQVFLAAGGVPNGNPVLALDIPPGQDGIQAQVTIQQGMLPPDTYQFAAVLDATTLIAQLTVQ